MPYLAYQSITWITVIQCSQVKVVVQLPLLPRGWISSSSEYLSDFISPSDMLVSIEPSPMGSALCNNLDGVIRSEGATALEILKDFLQTYC